ncbi:hypothetical protein [Methylobacterium brachythecii]|uniref:Uncharacterized protein n=1 Tax=Methylobacterium brachythecii TaxID=1176177 RepID=A0A7W6AI40_9HYPH|nr:hypothetical protein [Methylobacterium brachythecii]MBB3902771.1 hypothetical protein [Methylobacterium brachythecii]GLS46975.1 hypothetical protein GCM10007884_49750 [Methylobacterium brachythecii]
MDNSILIIALAIATLVIIAVVASVMRGRVAKAKGDPDRSSFTKHHGETPRYNKPGPDH